MKKNSKIFHFLTFVAFSSVFLVLLYFLIGRRIFSFNSRLEAEFKARQVSLQKTQELVRSLPNPEKAMDDLEKSETVVREMSYNKKQLPKMIQLMAESAIREGVEVLTMRPREDIKPAEPPPPGVAKVYMELVLHCEYRQLAGYIDSLTSLPYSFTVESLSVKKRDKGEAGHSLEAVLLCGTYMLWD